MLHLFEHEEDLTAIAPLLEGSSCCVVVADKNAYSYYGELIQKIFKPKGGELHLLLLSGSEKVKSLETVEKIWKRLSDIGADKSTVVVSFGGGTISDVVGFAASCYLRGVATFHFPTTLLAMVDASIGGKTGVNLSDAKNIVGSYHFPEAVFIYPKLLQSLPHSELCNGMAEVIKAAIVGDGELFSFLEENMADILNLEEQPVRHVIGRAIRVKEAIVEGDGYEADQRRVLNYGHTFGHAIETLGNYQHSHGEAVAIGMCCAAIASKKMGLADDAFILRQEQLCHKAGLPTALPDNFDDEGLVGAMRKDKKRTFKKFNLIVAEKVGKVIIAGSIEENFIRETLKEKREWDRHCE